MKLAMYSLLAASATATDLPVVCRLLQTSLSAVSNQPLVEDLGITAMPSIPVLGNMDVSVSRAEFGQLTIRDCEASLTSQGHFNVALVPLTLQFDQFEWRYEMLRWPHFGDSGKGSGSMSAAFNVTIDMNAESVDLAHMELDFIEMDLGAQRHSWLTSTLMKGVTTMRPIISAVLSKVFKLALTDTIKFIKAKGGCAFLDNILSKADFATVSFTSVVPVSVHVPMIGNVDISVNSTHVQQPTQMDCKHVGFDGATFEAHIENVPFSAGFNWAYRKPDSWFWHNHGDASVAVVAGAAVHINVLKPAETSVEVKMPALYLDINADSNHWLYGALSHVMGPLIRESLQLFGGRVAAYEVKKCLNDPNCPHWQQSGSLSAPIRVSKPASTPTKSQDIMVV
jgi:hypothetical protein